jgi:hypothetical protein
MPASISDSAVPCARSGTLDNVQAFAHAGHQHQGQGEAGTAAEAEGQRLHEVVFTRGLEQRDAEHRAIGGDQRQVDAQRAEQRRAVFLQHHLDQLHRRGDDHDVGDQAQELEVEGRQQQVEAVGAERSDEHDEGSRHTHREGRVELARDAEEGAEAEEHRQHEVVGQQRIDENLEGGFRHFARPPSPGGRLSVLPTTRTAAASRRARRSRRVAAP